MGEELKRAVLIGDIDDFYGIVKGDPEIHKILGLEETPLHVAAEHGKTELAIEILGLMPSFGKKLNPSGYCPLDVALRKGHREIVKQLIKLDPQLIGVQSRERKTPLHYVAETNNAELVAEFLVACPAAAKKLTIRGETALHLAVLRRSTRAFKVLMGWITRTDKEILGWKDNKGNTALHLAAQTRQVEVIEKLIEEKVDLDHKNQRDQTALEIVGSRILSRDCARNPITINVNAALHIVSDNIPNQEDVQIHMMLQQAGARKLSELPNLLSMANILTTNKYALCRNAAKRSVDLDKGITNDTRNAYLVVTVLILTATFQAFLSPPGGGWLNQDDNNNNSTSPPPAPSTINKPLSYTFTNNYKDFYFYPFVVVNSLTFSASLSLTFLLMPFRRYYSGLLPFSLVFLTFAYVLCGILMTPDEDKQTFTLISVLVGFIGFYSVVLRSIFPWVIRKIFLSSKQDTTIISVYEMEKQVRLGKYDA